MRQYKETLVHSSTRFSLLELLESLWHYRMLLWVFVKRDLTARYTQTILGLGWVVLTPLITVGVFVVIFGIMVKIPTDGIPTVMFYLVAVIPWYALLNVLNPTVQMIEGNAGLITKVYFPRLIIGGAYCISSTIDFTMGFVFLVLPFALWYDVVTVQLLVCTPFLLLCTLMTGLGVGLMLAPLNARYRDIKHFVPLALQLFYYSTPAIYPLSAVPVWAKPWYNVNPLSLVIAGFRDTLQGRWPALEQMAILFLIGTALLSAGVYMFTKYDRRVVDIL
jgi:lipopolysaccharide transport system permease protein